MRHLAIMAVCILGLSGCVTEEAPPATVTAQPGDAWQYTSTIGSRPGVTEWLDQAGELLATTQSLDNGQVRYSWGTAEGLLGIKSVTDPGTVQIDVFDRPCAHPYAIHFQALQDMACQGLTWQRHPEAGLIVVVTNPAPTVASLDPKTIETPWGPFEAQGIRIEPTTRAESGVSPEDSIVIWTTPSICAPLRIQYTSFEGEVQDQLDLSAARCGESRWGPEIGESPPPSSGTTAIDLSNQCSAAPVTLQLGDDATQASCPSRKLQGFALLASERPVTVSVAWPSTTSEHTLYVGETSASGTSPIVVETTMGTVQSAGEVTVQGIPPEYTDRYTFQIQYQPPFPIPAGVPFAYADAPSLS